jgi:hypothetical protein
MDIRCRDVDFWDGYASMRDISDEELGGVATAEGEDAKVGDTVECVDCKYSVDDVTLPWLDEDPEKEETKRDLEEDTS